MADVPVRRPETNVLKRNDGAETAMVHAASPIDVSRARLSKLHALAPEHTPSALRIQAALPVVLRDACRAAADFEENALEGALKALNATLPSSVPRPAPSVAAMIASNKLSDLDVHDLFFNVVRTGHDHPGAYLRSAIEALIIFRSELAESPTTLADGKRSAIVKALRRNVAAALGTALSSAPPTFETTPTPRFEDYAPRRWLRGHQLFAALTQGLIFAVEALHAATEGGERDARDAAADLLVVNMDACAATLELTGDFPAGIYEDLIRPGMSLPHQPKGFSGLLSADHCHLVRRMKATRPAMERLRDEEPLRHGAVVAALAGVYDSHKHVCGRFVGTEASSLLMRSDTPRSSVEQLERFKTSRLRQIV